MAKLKSKAGACSSHTQGAKANLLQHNRREGKLASYVLSDRSKFNITFYEAEDIKNVKTMKTLQHQAEIEYTRLTGQKCQKSFTPFRESVLVVNDHVTKDMMDNYRKKTEKLTGWRCLGLWYHRDEGYQRQKKNGAEPKINFHIHCLWDCQDHTTGKIIRPKSRNLFSKMQDVLAECVGMERGEYAKNTGKEHLDRNEFILQKQREEAEQLAEKVGTGAKVAAWFGVGELAEIRRKTEKAEHALQEAKVAHAEELARETKKSRQEGYNEAISAVKKSAKLFVRGDNDTAEDIGKAWRNAFNERKDAKEKVKRLEEDAKSRSKETTNAAASLAVEKRKAENAVADTLQKVNKVMFRVGNGRFSENDLARCEDIEKTLGSSMPLNYTEAKNNLCRSIRAWAELKWDGKKSPDALALLKKLFIAMKEAFRKLLALVGSSPERQQAAIDDVRLQLKFSPGIEEHEWDEAVQQSAEEYIASYVRTGQKYGEELPEEELTRSHGWQR